jgi:hypothetical protein
MMCVPYTRSGGVFKHSAGAEEERGFCGEHPNCRLCFVQFYYFSRNCFNLILELLLTREGIFLVILGIRARLCFASFAQVTLSMEYLEGKVGIVFSPEKVR